MYAKMVAAAVLSTLALALAPAPAAASPTPPADPEITAVAGGQSTSVALDSSGHVWAWGGNGGGQLGDGTRTNRPTPALVQDAAGGLLTNVQALASYTQTLALLEDGTVRGWGSNGSGQLGQQPIGGDQLRAVPVPGLPLVKAVATSQVYSMALAIDDGTVWTWGSNNDGQLGNGSSSNAIRGPERVVIDKDKPVGDPARYLRDVIAISAGIQNHSVALKKEGTVWTWGRNNAGQAGNGTISPSATIPVQAKISATEILTGIIAIETGNGHTLAVRNDGTVWSWGSNVNGYLGDDSTETRTRPVQVHGLTNVATVSAGAFWSLARKHDHTAWAWGLNASGQLCDGTTDERHVPVQVKDASGGNLQTVASVSAGASHALFVLDNQTVLACGTKEVGQLGDGTVAPFSALPGQVLDGTGLLTGIDEVFAAGPVSIARTSAGAYLAWGGNGFGQLGDGTPSTSNRLLPVPMFLSGALAAVCGGAHTLAINADATVRAWGNGSQGQIGGPSGLGLTGVVGIAAGANVSMAVKADHSAWAWGNNADGQLGNNSIVVGFTPVPVQVVLDQVKAVATGGFASYALRDDRTVWAWGLNNLGQLGNGTNDNSRTAVQVSGLTDVRAIAASVTALGRGGSFAVALKYDGTVWTWGLNTLGQLGDGSKTNRNAPVQVQGLSGAVAIAAGGFHGLARRFDGTVWSWGVNSSGQLGNGTTSDALTAVQVQNLSGATAIAAGGSHSLAVLSDHTVRSWGSSANGQLGDGIDPNSTAPVCTRFPPVIALNAPDPMIVECQAAFVDPATASEICLGDLTSRIMISGSVDPNTVGTYPRSYAVTDGLNTATNTRTVNVVDTTPPVIAQASPTPAILWPPNHMRVPVRIDVTSADTCDPASMCRIVSVSNNESGGGADAEITGDLTVELVAERSGNSKQGRVYSIEVECGDASQNRASVSVSVVVPHDQ